MLQLRKWLTSQGYLRADGNDVAEGSGGAKEKYNLGDVSITDATVATTKVQLTQSLTEMASGIAKNAADHTKGLGRKIGGG